MLLGWLKSSLFSQLPWCQAFKLKIYLRQNQCWHFARIMNLYILPTWLSLFYRLIIKVPMKYCNIKIDNLWVLTGASIFLQKYIFHFSTSSLFIYTWWRLCIYDSFKEDPSTFFHCISFDLYCKFWNAYIFWLQCICWSRQRSLLWEYILLY